MQSSGFAHRQRAAEYDFIPPERVPAKRGKSGAARRKADAVDAEFVVIRTPLHGYYRILNDNQGAEGRRGGDHWAVSVLRSGAVLLEKGLRQLSPKGFAALVTGCFFLVFATVFLTAGDEAQATTPVVSGGVSIQDIHTSIVDSAGLRILEISGIAKNVAGGDVVAPRLVASIRSGNGFEPAAYFKLPIPVISAGTSVPFSVRLPHPGGKLPEVSVSADAATN